MISIIHTYFLIKIKVQPLYKKLYDNPSYNYLYIEDLFIQLVITCIIQNNLKAYN